MGACNQEERFWNFYCGVVTRRHSFGFSRNNMKGAFLIRETKIGSSLCSVFPLRIFMGACNQGRKVLEFLLWCRHS